MIVAMLPGFALNATEYLPWTRLLPADVRLFNLPGHGPEPPLARYSLAAMADRYMDRIPRDALVVGESLGGLVALELATRGYRVVAFEPPLSTAKLWPLHLTLRPLATQQRTDALYEFVEAMFGMNRDGEFEERNAWPLLERLPSRVEIVGADLPLWPPRSVTSTPSVLDEVDAYHLERHPRVSFRRIAGPHYLLTQSLEAARPVLMKLIEANAN